MGVNATTVGAGYRSALEDLVGHFAVDAGFLRHHDRERRSTHMVAEWPDRVDVPDPDPLGVVRFADADPVFAAAEFLREPLLFRPDPAMEDYRHRVEAASGYTSTSMVSVPLLSHDITTGVIGLVASGDREWSDDEVDALEAIATLFSQLQARIDAEEHLRWAATHDALTGLLNRRGVSELLSARLAGGGDTFAVLYFDLDRLKALNDFLGHSAGDTFLRTVGARLQRHSDADTLLARWGGDEFVVVLPGPLTEDDAYAEACRILTVVTARVDMAGEYVSRTASIGVALGIPGSGTVDSVIADADQAALAAKSAGGNQVSLFSSEIRERNELHNDIELHLRAAIEGESLLLHFQPEIDLTTDRITAVEALVRWQHPTRGMLPPIEFIAIAEAVNLATDLGRWVLHTACRIYASWRSTLGTLDIALRVNVSPAQLVSLDFVHTVREALSRYALEPQCLCIEITEVAVVHDIVLAARALREVRALGVRVAIDDFGTGYSSLSHLGTLPVDVVKIDREFVTHLATSLDDRAIVEAVTALARAYDLDLVAEGLEDVDARAVLLELGCTRAQGYLYARPRPADVVLEMLRIGTLTPS
ncbi:EAL domain-containing protein [Rhodococcus sp. BP-349]|nr:EAL domain-containing protein [Rhodococcus sp. BP-363]MBY6545343.1 EAL domain-containing protein [Rhodococcus sp. BP-369]MBY6564573.1 EAL domain-containing protein [Rhodococcus sp. BP-370]MBY6578491.1 EAL domain-containing protein [Rhodococcus sp. BP-364]MBY6587792.1 EAL domain-containing protein [Rhodococcus sp. BP-358]MBY6592129.1 EAL domain-containing protein [Rhodococcus sp. BP-362]MBY6596840.1 EAL domain-containing protein [Rhodococcus sp. BP-359]MBY6601179.1 EAL domain-containing pr